MWLTIWGRIVPWWGRHNSKRLTQLVASPPVRKQEEASAHAQVSLTFSLCLGHQSVVEPHQDFWVGLPISTHLKKSLVDLLEACLLGDSRSCEEDNVNHQRGKEMQLLWLEVGWADMEEGQGLGVER